MTENPSGTALENDETAVVVDPIIVALCRERRARKWTQRAVALQLGVSPPTVSGWESGRSVPPLPQVRRWAALFDMDIDLIRRPPNDEEAEAA